jgi:hypothetical protein
MQTDKVKLSRLLLTQKPCGLPSPLIASVRRPMYVFSFDSP